MIFAFLLLGSWSSLTGPKTAQEALTTSAQEAPRGTKRLLRGTRRLFRCLQEAPKKHPESRRGSHDAQEAPRGPQEAPKRSQEAPRRPSRGSKRPPGGSQENSERPNKASFQSSTLALPNLLHAAQARWQDCRRCFILNATAHASRISKAFPVIARGPAKLHSDARRWLYRAFSMLHKNGNKIADNTHRFINVAEGGPAAEAEP